DNAASVLRHRTLQDDSRAFKYHIVFIQCLLIVRSHDPGNIRIGKPCLLCVLIGDGKGSISFRAGQHPVSGLCLPPKTKEQHRSSFYPGVDLRHLFVHLISSHTLPLPAPATSPEPDSPGHSTCCNGLHLLHTAHKGRWSYNTPEEGEASCLPSPI